MDDAGWDARRIDIALRARRPGSRLPRPGRRRGRRVWHWRLNRRPLNRRTAWLGAVLLAATALIAAPSPGTAAVGTSDATLISTFPAAIAPVFSTSTQSPGGPAAGKPTGAGTGAAAAAVSSACAAGDPLVSAQWYVLPASGATRVSVVGHQTGHSDPDQQPVNFAFVTHDTQDVLSCGDAPASLPPDRPVLLVAYFAHSAPKCDSDETWFDCDATVPLGTVHQRALGTPPHDDWQNARPISGDSFFATVNTTEATFDGLGPIRDGECFLSQFDAVYLGNVWYRYTPSFTGHVNVAARSEKPGYWAWPVIAELGPEGPIEPGFDDTGECVGTTNVEAGKTYLIGVGGWYSPYFGEPNPIGGMVSVSVSPLVSLRVVRDLQVSTDSAAHSATISWSTWPEGATPAGFRVARTGPDGEWSTIVGPGTRSFTFTHLEGWEPYRLTVDTLDAGLTVHGGTPRATAFAYLSQPQPSRPHSVAALISGVQRIDVTWSEPAFSGTGPITGYRVRQFTPTGTTAEATWTLPASARSLAVTGPAFGRGYRYDVTAFNGAGAGRPSAKTAPVTLTGLPSAPTAVAATGDTAARTATLTWQPPVTANGGRITGYRVGRDGTDSAGAGPWSATVSAGSRSLVFQRLVPGRTYTLFVRAITAQGTGATATVTVRL